MIKNLLSTALVAATSLVASAGTITLWEGNVEFTGWDKNIIIDASEFTAVAEGDVITAETKDWCTLIPDQNYTLLGFKTGVEGWPELDGTGFLNPTADAPNASITLSATNVAELKATGLIIQGSNCTVTKVTLTSSADIDPNLLFEGEATIAGWNKAGDVSASKLKAGDVLEYTFTDAGTESSQVIVKGSDWSNLLGTFKMTNADFAKGKVQVGVTQEMLDACGGTIFLQGDGGVVLTKVTLIPGAIAEGVENVIAYGERQLGISAFITLKEGTDKIEVVMASKPNWLQVSNSSWTPMVETDGALSVTENADGTVSYVFPLTADNVATVNTAKEIIFNGDAPILAVKYVATGALTTINADADAPAEYFDLQGRRVDNPASGLYIVRQGSKVSKVIL